MIALFTMSIFQDSQIEVTAESGGFDIALDRRFIQPRFKL